MNPVDSVGPVPESQRGQRQWAGGWAKLPSQVAVDPARTGAHNNPSHVRT
jgi:hypothetical protein